MTDNWTHVNEKFPDKSGEYLVCFRNGDMDIVKFENSVLSDELFPFGYWDIEYDELGHHIPDWVELKSVQWWQPLPNRPEGCI